MYLQWLRVWTSIITMQFDFYPCYRLDTEEPAGAHVSGGVSNLSFSFRGNNYIREAMHAVFLYHAIREGMDMGIVNPATSVLYTDIPADILERIEDVVLNRRSDAAERLIETAERLKAEAEAAKNSLSNGNSQLSSLSSLACLA